MRTYKPISTVSYNTRCFLFCTLDSLVQQGFISFWAFVRHYGEGGRKDHWHVYAEPTSTIDTASAGFVKLWQEPDPDNDKPLSCEPWRKSKFDDWLLYSQHDADYLDSKGLKKEYCDYPLSAFSSSDPEEFKGREGDINRIKYKSPAARMIACMERGMSLKDAMCFLRIPYGSMHSFITFWNILQNNTDFERKI